MSWSCLCIYFVPQIRTTSKLSFFRFEWVNLVVDKMSDLEKSRMSAKSPSTIATTRKFVCVALFHFFAFVSAIIYFVHDLNEWMDDLCSSAVVPLCFLPRCMHIELQWLACSAEGVLDFVDKMARVVRTARDDGPLRRDGKTPDMRYKENRDKYLPPGKNQDGTPDKRLAANRENKSAAAAAVTPGVPSEASTTHLEHDGAEADAVETPRSRKADAAAGVDPASDDPFGTETARCALLVKFPGFLREPVAKFCDPWQVFVKHDVFRKRYSRTACLLACLSNIRVICSVRRRRRR